MAGTIRTGIVQRTTIGGGKKLYAIGLHYSNIKDEDLISHMQTNSQISLAAAVAAVKAFKAVLSTFLVNGHTIVVPRFGTFSLTLSSKRIADTRPAKTETEAEKKAMREFLTSLVNGFRGVKVRYTPTAQVSVAAKSAKFQGILVDDTVGPNP